MARATNYGPYRKIYTRMASDEKCMRLKKPPPCGYSLWLEILIGEQTVIVPGLFKIGEAAFAEQLGWDLDGFRAAWEELASQGMVKADWKTKLVWVPNALKYNAPTSINCIKSWAVSWEELPDCDLKLEAYNHMRKQIKKINKVFLRTFDLTCRKPFGKRKALSARDLTEPLAKPLPSDMPSDLAKPLASALPNDLASDMPRAFQGALSIEHGALSIEGEEKTPLPPPKKRIKESAQLDRDLKQGLRPESLFAGPALAPGETETDFAIFRREFIIRVGVGTDSAFIDFWERGFANIHASLDEMRYALDCWLDDPRRNNEKTWNGKFPREAMRFMPGYILKKRREAGTPVNAPEQRKPTPEEADADQARLDAGFLKQGSITEAEFERRELARKQKRQPRSANTGDERKAATG